MSIFYKSSYVISCNDENYIKAISSYNKGAYVVKIDGKDVAQKDMIYCDQLHQILNKKDENSSITIHCTSTNSDSTKGAFPSINAKEIHEQLDALHNPWIDSFQESAKASTEFIVSKLERSYLNRNADHRTAMSDPSWNLEMTLPHALFVTKNLQANKNVLGAIHLKDLNMIIFQYDTNQGVENFALTYAGDNPGLRCLSHFGLDIDDGFHVAEEDHPSELMNALNVAFNQWKKNHYQGPLFKSFNAPSQENKVDNKLTSNSLFKEEAKAYAYSTNGLAVKKRIGL